MGDAFFDGDPLPRMTTNPESEVASAYRAALDVPQVGDLAEVELTRDSVVGIDLADYHQWTIGNVPAGSFPLFGFYKIINNSTETPTPGDHAVSLISLFEDATGASLDGYAGEARTNARGTGNYKGFNAKLTYQQSGSQVPAASGSASAALWADVHYLQSDNVTPLTTAGLYAISYLTTAIEGGDPLLRYSFLGYDRIRTTSTTAASATGGSGSGPDGSIQAGGGIYAALNLVCGAGGTFGDAVGITKSTNALLNCSLVNTNAGAAAGTTMAMQTDAGTAYFGKASNAFSTVPGTAGKSFIYDTTGIVLTGSATKVDSIIVSTQTPASASAAGVAGTIAWDASYIYVCIATNTWKRVAIATW